MSKIEAIDRANSQAFAELGYYVNANQANLRKQGVQYAHIMKHMVDTVSTYAFLEFQKEIDEYIHTNKNNAILAYIQDPFDSNAKPKLILDMDVIDGTGGDEAIANFVHHMNTHAKHAKLFGELFINPYVDTNQYRAKDITQSSLISASLHAISADTITAGSYEEQAWINGTQKRLSNITEKTGSPTASKLTAMTWLRRILHINDVAKWQTDAFNNLQIPNNASLEDTYNMDAWKHALADERGTFKNTQFCIITDNLTEQEYIDRETERGRAVEVTKNAFGWALRHWDANRDVSFILPNIQGTEGELNETLQGIVNKDGSGKKFNLKVEDKDGLAQANISAVNLDNGLSGLFPLKMQYPAGVLETIANEYAKQDFKQKGRIDPAQASVIVNDVIKQNQTDNTSPHVVTKVIIDNKSGHTVVKTAYGMNVDFGHFGSNAEVDNILGKAQIQPTDKSKPSFIFVEQGGKAEYTLIRETNSKDGMVRTSAFSSTLTFDPVTQKTHINYDGKPIELLSSTSHKLNGVKATNAVVYGRGNGVAYLNQNFASSYQIEKTLKGLTTLNKNPQDIAIAMQVGMEALSQLSEGDKPDYFTVSDNDLKDKASEIYKTRLQQQGMSSETNDVSEFFDDPVFAYNVKAYRTYGFDFDHVRGVTPKHEFKEFSENFQNNIFVPKSVMEKERKQVMVNALQAVASARLALNGDEEQRRQHFEDKLGYEIAENGEELKNDELVKEFEPDEYRRGQRNKGITSHTTEIKMLPESAESFALSDIANETNNNYVQKKYLNNNEHQIFLTDTDGNLKQTTVSLPNSRRMHADLFVSLKSDGLATGYTANMLGAYNESIVRVDNDGKSEHILHITHTEGMDAKNGIYVLTGLDVEDTHNILSPAKYAHMRTQSDSDEQRIAEARQIGKTALTVFRMQFSPQGNHKIETADDVKKITSAQHYINNGNGVEKKTAMNTEPLGTITPLIENIDEPYIATSDEPNVVYLGEGLETMHAVCGIFGMHKGTPNTAVYSCHDVNNLKKIAETMAKAQMDNDDPQADKRDGSFKYDKSVTKICIMGDNDYVWRGTDPQADMLAYVQIFQKNEILPSDPKEFMSLYKRASISTQLGETFQFEKADGSVVEIPPLKSDKGKVMKNAGFAGAIYAREVLQQAGYDTTVVFPNQHALESLRKYDHELGGLQPRERTGRSDWTDFSDLFKVGERYVYERMLNEFGTESMAVAQNLSQNGSFYKNDFVDELGHTVASEQTALHVFKETQKALAIEGVFFRKPQYWGLDENKQPIVTMEWSQESYGEKLKIGTYANGRSKVSANIKDFQQNMLLGKEEIWGKENINNDEDSNIKPLVPTGIAKSLPEDSPLAGIFMTSDVVSTALPRKEQTDKMLLNRSYTLDAEIEDNVALSMQAGEGKGIFKYVPKNLGMETEWGIVSQKDDLKKEVTSEYQVAMAFLNSSAQELERFEKGYNRAKNDNKELKEEWKGKAIKSDNIEKRNTSNKNKMVREAKRDDTIAYALDADIEKQIEEYCRLSIAFNNETSFKVHGSLLENLPEETKIDYKEDCKEQFFSPDFNEDKTNEHINNLRKELDKKAKEIDLPDMKVLLKDFVAKGIAKDHMEKLGIEEGSLARQTVLHQGNSQNDSKDNSRATLSDEGHKKIDKIQIKDKDNAGLQQIVRNTARVLAVDGNLPNRADDKNLDENLDEIRDKNAQNEQNRKDERENDIKPQNNISNAPKI